MPDTIEGYVLGQIVPMRVGDKVGLLETGFDWQDTFAGQEVEIADILDKNTLTVRTYNGYELIVGRLEVVPAMPKRRGGRNPVPRADGDELIKTSIVLRESDMAFLLTIHPRNVSAAIRQLISDRKGINNV